MGLVSYRPVTSKFFHQAFICGGALRSVLLKPRWEGEEWAEEDAATSGGTKSVEFKLKGSAGPSRMAPFCWGLLYFNPHFFWPGKTSSSITLCSILHIARQLCRSLWPSHIFQFFKCRGSLEVIGQIFLVFINLRPQQNPHPPHPTLKSSGFQALGWLHSGDSPFPTTQAWKNKVGTLDASVFCLHFSLLSLLNIRSSCDCC